MKLLIIAFLQATLMHVADTLALCRGVKEVTIYSDEHCERYHTLGMQYLKDHRGLAVLAQLNKQDSNIIKDQERSTTIDIDINSINIFRIQHSTKTMMNVRIPLEVRCCIAATNSKLSTGEFRKHRGGSNEMQRATGHNRSKLSKLI